MANYNFTISTTYPGGVNYQNLYDEILNSTITTELLGFMAMDDVLTIKFAGTLSGAEQTELDNVNSNHSYTPPTKQSSKTSQMELNIENFTDISWQVIATYIFPGPLMIAEIIEVMIASYMDNGGTSYDLELKNMDNGDIIGNGNFNNTSLTINSLSNINNTPNNRCILELRAKVNGATTIHVKNLTIGY